MKKYIIPFILLSVVACEKQFTGSDIIAEDSTEPIVIGVTGDDLSAVVYTKATEVTSVPSSVNWLATSGTINTAGEAKKYNNKAVSLATENGKITGHTGYYWPSTNTSYNFYVCYNAESSNAISFTAGTGATISANTNKDVLAAKGTATWKSTLDMNLQHIFARTANLILNTQSGYDLSDVSWTIKSNTGGGTAGTYNITKGTWSGQTALAQTAIGAADAGNTSASKSTHTSDMYLIPGSYRVDITYTLTKGDYTETFTKGADITLVAGKKNTITATAVGGTATEIIITVSLTAWGTNSITIPSIS